MIVLLALCAFLFWGGVFLVFFQANDTSIWDFVLGKQEPLPEPLGKWHALEEHPDDVSEILESRYLYDPGWGGGKLTLQRRYRDRVSGDIVRVLRDERVTRRRRR